MLKGRKNSLKGKVNIRTGLSFVIIKQKFKITTINMCRVLMENVDSMLEQMNNVSREIEMLKIQKKF